MISALPQSKSSRRTLAIYHCFLPVTSTITPAAQAQIPLAAAALQILRRNHPQGRQYEPTSARTRLVSRPHP